MTDPQRPSHDPTADTSIHRTADPSVVDAPVTATAAEPVGMPAGAATPPVAPRSRARWLAAGVIVALVVGISALAALSLTGSSPNATVVGYVPTDSVAYGELRLDLPGDQRREIGAFLSKFPGFADQAALDTKLDEVLDRLVSEGTDGEQTFTSDIKPWFDGEIAFAMGPLPTSAPADDPAAVAASVRALVLIAVKDGAAASAWFRDAMDEAGVGGTTESYGGTDLTVYSDPDMGDARAAFAVIGGEVAVAGDLASVKAAVDTRGDSALVEDADFDAALTALEGDHVGFMYMDLRAVMDAALRMDATLGMDAPMSEQLLAMIPDWMAFRLRVEGDALAMDSVAPHVEGMPGPDADRANGVAAYAPPTTVMLAAGNDAGATILDTLDLYGSDPSMSDGMAELEQALAIIGGLDGAVGWMGDTGVVVSRAGDSLEGGIVSVPTDAAEAERFLTTIRSLLAIGGGQAGIEVREEAYAGTTITIVDLGSASDLLGLAGMLGGMPLDPGSTDGLPEGSIELSYAATDGVVVIGSGPGFVKAVLDAGAGDSLADGARYRDLVASAGAEHTGVSFIDIAAIRALAEGLLAEASAEERAEYEESVKPFLEPLDALVAVSTLGGATDSQHVRLSVK
ncbi:MAG: DUF3352 domain-containing protein [Candidatus Limnocylindria bacterium]